MKASADSRLPAAPSDDEIARAGAFTVAVGIGCQRGAGLDTLAQALDAALRTLGPVSVRCIASHRRKADEPALLALAASRGWPLLLYSAEQLAAVAVPNPSAGVAAKVGTASVAEAAALRASGQDELLVAKRALVGPDGKGVTVAVARCREGAPEPMVHQAPHPGTRSRSAWSAEGDDSHAHGRM